MSFSRCDELLFVVVAISDLTIFDPQSGQKLLSPTSLPQFGQ